MHGSATSAGVVIPLDVGSNVSAAPSLASTTVHRFCRFALFSTSFRSCECRATGV
jgi:hypothetical protein